MAALVQLLRTAVSFLVRPHARLDAALGAAATSSGRGAHVPTTPRGDALAATDRPSYSL
jgi:hypothetical protein